MSVEIQTKTNELDDLDDLSSVSKKDIENEAKEVNILRIIFFLNVIFSKILSLQEYIKIYVFI